MIYTATEHLPSHYNMRDLLGFIPLFLSEEDPQGMREQINQHYAHGGGWRPSQGFTLDRSDMSLNYPGDPPLLPWVETRLRDEVLMIYDCAICMILSPDDSFTVARLE